jgi:hypothetical protein
MITRTSFLFLLLSFLTLKAQDDLLDQIDMPDKAKVNNSAFLSTRVINTWSTRMIYQKHLELRVEHHFGTVKQGAYDFFGLDNASMRLGFAYGIMDWLTVSIGRNSYEKMYDGHVKFRILSQKGKKGQKGYSPISIVLVEGLGINSLKPSTISPTFNDLDFKYRMNYSNQLLISGYYWNRFSFQTSFSYIHQNLVETKQKLNGTFGIGIGFAVRVAKRVTINVENQFRVQEYSEDGYYNSFSIGTDINTGGHVFQLFFTNSRGSLPEQFIPDTSDNFWNGDIRFGFAITRMWSFEKEKKEEI